jgi:hypothetical protein
MRGNWCCNTNTIKVVESGYFHCPVAMMIQSKIQLGGFPKPIVVPVATVAAEDLARGQVSGKRFQL